MFSILYHCWKGSGFKKGVCKVIFMPWEPLSGGSSQCLSLSEGSRLPLPSPSPPCHLTVFISGNLYKWVIMDEMFRAATMVAAFLVCLGILHCPCQLDHGLLGHPLNSTGTITLWVFAIASILFLQMCQVHSRLFLEWLITLEFPQGEETSSPWLWEIISSLGSEALGPSEPPWWPLGNLSMSSPADLA